MMQSQNSTCSVWNVLPVALSHGVLPSFPTQNIDIKFPAWATIQGTNGLSGPILSPYLFSRASRKVCAIPCTCCIALSKLPFAWCSPTGESSITSSPAQPLFTASLNAKLAGSWPDLHIALLYPQQLYIYISLYGQRIDTYVYR